MKQDGRKLNHRTLGSDPEDGDGMRAMDAGNLSGDRVRNQGDFTYVLFIFFWTRRLAVIFQPHGT
jgi:hypothetical protein